MPVGKRRARDIIKGSEFGGVDGLVQPAPHVPTAREQLISIHQRKVLPPENTDFQTWEEVPGDMRNDVLTASTDQYSGLMPEPTIESTFQMIQQALEELSPDDKEKLALMIDPKPLLSREMQAPKLQRRRTDAEES